VKLVREHIYEKFEEHSDPITDMGIGGVDINAEWDDVSEENFRNSEFKDIYAAWKDKLEKIFIGRVVKGNFSVGNSNSYGAVQKGITTKSKVVRIELEEERDFSLICIKKNSWENHPDDDGEWVDPDEIWYVVELDENPGLITFVK
jgi:hypothetical protein